MKKSHTLLYDIPSDAFLDGLPEPMNGYSIIRKYCEATVLACKDKEVADLNEEEKFAIAFLAGVPLAPQYFTGDDCSCNMTFTTVPCAIAKIDGKFHVACDDRKL